MRKFILPLIMMLFIASSCTTGDSFTSPKSVEGYKPVYISKEKAYTLDVEGPRSFADPGKMFLYQNFYLCN
jgi:hypothetical protein